LFSKYIRPLTMALSASVLCWLTPHPARAWGSEGHQVVALIAESALEPQARAAVEQLLALEPGATLASISTWADEHRSPATSAWHYVNFPQGDCNFQETRDCPDGHCVVAAIQKQTEVLATDPSAEKRLKALKYLVHFMADVHQPLHAGFAEDRGGNKFTLKRFMQQTNLHAVWDSGLIRYTGDTAESLASRLSREPPDAAATDADPVQIAQESCRLVHTRGFYPKDRIDGAYLQRYVPVMEQRLALAGWRLAEVLNTVLGDGQPQERPTSAVTKLLRKIGRLLQ
jgi:nuclease S1